MKRDKLSVSKTAAASLQTVPIVRQIRHNAKIVHKYTAII